MKTGIAGSGPLVPYLAANLRDAGVETTILRPHLDGTAQSDPAAGFGRDIVVLFIVTNDADDAEETLFAKHGILRSAKSLEILIVLGQISKDVVLELRNRVPRHVEMIDAIPFGTTQMAAEARLQFALGGNPDVIDEVMLHFSALGDQFDTTGPLGSAASQAQVHPQKN